MLGSRGHKELAHIRAANLEGGPDGQTERAERKTDSQDELPEVQDCLPQVRIPKAGAQGGHHANEVGHDDKRRGGCSQKL